ncbi:hypothetical protein ACRU3B_13345 [Mycobacterium colombiense]
MKNVGATYGEYAIVTGASSGVGEQFAGRRSYAVPGVSNRIGDLLVKHVLPRSVSVKAFGWMLKRALTDTTPRWDRDRFCYSMIRKEL